MHHGSGGTQIAARFEVIGFQRAVGEFQWNSRPRDVVRRIHPVLCRHFDVAAIDWAPFSSLRDVPPTQRAGAVRHMVESAFHRLRLPAQIDADVIEMRPRPVMILCFREVILRDGNGGEDGIHTIGEAILYVSAFPVIELAAVRGKGIGRQSIRVIHADVEMNRIGELQRGREFKARLEHAFRGCQLAGGKQTDLVEPVYRLGNNGSLLHGDQRKFGLPRNETRRICLTVHTSSQDSTPFVTARCVPSVGAPKEATLHDAGKTTRLAVMGGSYGNVPALTACLAHAKQQGCDGFAFIGDSTGCCGHSDETLQIIRDHFGILVAGNHEQKAAAGEEDCGCNYANEEDNHYGGLAHRWAMRSLSDENRKWLGAWPDLAVIETGAGKILLCHGSPAQTNEFLYESELEDSRLERWLDQYGAVGFVCTHSGFPWIRRLAGNRFAMNCGVCGKPDHDHDAAVHYATVELRSGEPHRLSIERVEYDHLAFAEQLDREGVDDAFTIPIRNGVWTCGLLSMPATERVLRPRPSGWLNALRPR
jgi:hypothetical protein